MAGFSLLEILVVLGIISVMLAVAGGRLAEMVDATRFVRSAEAAVMDVKLIRARAVLDGRAQIIIPNDAAFDAGEVPYRTELRHYQLPEGWKASGDVIYIDRSGFCAGGKLRFAAPSGRQIAFELRAPDCAAQRIALFETS